ncbi:MAG: class I SAM-dependent methyltransferase [Pseudomonadota bacterium]
MTIDATFISDANSAIQGDVRRNSGRPASLASSVTEKLLTSFFGRLVTTGRLTLIDPWGHIHHFGLADGPHVTVRVKTAAALYRILLRPDLYAGEAYMDGALSIEEGGLREFLYICTSNQDALNNHPLALAFGKAGKALRKLHQFNPQSRSRSNVAHHYDLSATLYDLFLDADRQYSCAYFPDGDETLEQAQYKKKQLIASKLVLEPGQRVLDIGCGWGGMALHLARTAGADVTGITLSQEQLSIAQQRAADANLSGQARFVLRDYRDECGAYDRLVSVGMFEHVGVNHYAQFFEKCRDLLKPDGVGLLHAIGRMAPPDSTNPWIRKYIFPGGYCPALSEVLGAIEHAGLWVTDIEILRPHYADTLRHWQDRFQANRDAIKALYDERFCRMWEFYLASCEISFRTGPMMVFQIQFARSRDAVPRTRSYLGDVNAAPVVLTAEKNAPANDWRIAQ